MCAQNTKSQSSDATIARHLDISHQTVKKRQNACYAQMLTTILVVKYLPIFVLIALAIIPQIAPNAQLTYYKGTNLNLNKPQLDQHKLTHKLP